MTLNKQSETISQPVSYSSLNNQLLVDQLQHKTQLLIAATNSGIADQAYLKSLQQEVEKIQFELKARQL
jgi:hypothetical protein